MKRRPLVRIKKGLVVASLGHERQVHIVGNRAHFLLGDGSAIQQVLLLQGVIALHSAIGYAFRHSLAGEPVGVAPLGVNAVIVGLGLVGHQLGDLLIVAIRSIVHG